ncbi:MAG: hypothetical protein A2X81_14960 [Desulfobacterales bacterium GWB2_56_26]|nr:MAG: hypothetical protein A2X81_14960 [Desulfobacterales bacterium GWB2_56_26]
MGKILLSILLVFALANGALGEAPKKVTLATLTDFAPYCFAKDKAVFIPVEHIPPGSDSLQLQGYSWDVVRESFHAMGYIVRLLVVPWERGTHYLANGKVDFVFPANKTVEREKKDYVFSEEYVDQIETVIYMQRDENFAWRGLDSLDGLSIGFVRGWAYGKHWEGADRIVKESTDSILQGFEMLGKGRLFGFAGYKRPYDHVLKTTGQTHLYKIVGQFDTIDEFLMGRRADGDNRQLLQAFDEGKRKIRENGILQQIEEKWQQ